MECYSINMKVDPLVKRWLDRNFKTVGGCYTMGGSCYYAWISALLYRSRHVGDPAAVPAKYSRFVPVRVCVSEFDFFHYGWEVSVSQELRFSQMVRNMLVDECLRSVAILRARYDMALSQAINTYVVYYGLDDKDVNVETLRKTYNRKYRSVEDEYRNIDRMAVTDFGVTDSTPAARSLRLHPRNSDPNQLELPL